jgi:hypothetical protein
MNSELTHISEWFKANKLSLNIDKTNFIIFKNKNKPIPQHFDILLDHKPIQQVKFTKFLGVYIDEHLSWKEHIRIIENKISKNCGIIRKLSRILPKNTLLILYNSLVLPYLSYCTFIWATTDPSKLLKIVTLQKRCVRAICSLAYNTHTTSYFKSLNILKIHDLCNLQVNQFMYKHQRSLLPKHFAKFFSLNSITHDHFTRQFNNYHINSVRTKLGQMNIKFIGPKYWNKLPPTIQASTSLHMFTANLKTLLLETY